MTQELSIALFVSDPAVLSSLEFALTVEGLLVSDGDAADNSRANAAAVVIDRSSVQESLAQLARIRAYGCPAPAIVLATNPTRRQSAAALAAGAVLVEKPLLGDGLTRALRAALSFEKAA